jgi:hypothetical protein
VVIGLLAGLAVAAVALVAVLAFRDSPPDPVVSWSAWKPTSKERLVRAAKIAQYVGREYRLNDGSQLVDVEAGPLSIGDVALTPVIRTSPTGGDIIPIYGDGILYVLNGLGRNGAISKEKPSAQRLALVEREALELALYTFRYVPDVDHVVTMLPATVPATADGKPASTADGTSSTAKEDAAPLTEDNPVTSLLFRPGDLKPRLEAPLALTFPTAPPRPATMTSQEQQAMAQITADHIFSAQVVPNQAGQGFLVMDRPEVTSRAEAILRSTIPKKRPGTG